MEVFRDEYLAYMTGGGGRPLFVELFGLLVGLEDEWRAQGASAAELSLTDFGFDYVRRHHVAVSTELWGGFPEEIVSEDADARVTRDRYGRLSKLCKASATIPLPLEYPVTDMDSWLRLKPMYQFHEQRFAKGWLSASLSARDAGALVVASIPGGFNEPRELMGEEALCLAYYEDPELIHDMLSTMGETAYRVLERVSDAVPIDVLSVHEDLAGKSGALIGPAQIQTFIQPYYRRVWDMLSSRGARIFQQDSDGNMNSVIPAFLEAGINCMLPMEPAAGMDMVQVRKQYGERLMLMGGIDKHILREPLDRIHEELTYKLQPIMQRGVVFGLDHRIPNGTPLAHYRYYVQTARALLGLDPHPTPGWARMAF